MDSFDRSRPSDNRPPPPSQAPFSSFRTDSQYPPEPQRIALPQEHHPDEKLDSPPVFMKGPKRKRLAKACDACHKSKRRCDGTAPCSNCYYASKACTYTDSAGRPVPAPRSFKQERDLPQNQLQPGPSNSDYRSSFGSQAPYPSDAPRYSQQHRTYPPTSAPSSTSAPPELSDDDRINRKRFRNDRGTAISSEDIFLDGPIIGITLDRPAHVELDHALTRELTNLFFTHCHPARVVIHKPSFSNALSHNRVPKHLLYAVCALAAPVSKQPRIRTTPSRYAGKPFAQEALSLMFDGAGRLVCEPDLATAQALAILLMHDVLTKEKNSMWNSRYADLALQIIENLGVHEPDHPTLTPMPSPDFIHQSFKREAVRRIFWLIHLCDVMASLYFKKPTTFTPSELRLRLPVDETSFELGVHTTLPGATASSSSVWLCTLRLIYFELPPGISWDLCRPAVTPLVRLGLLITVWRRDPTVELVVTQAAEFIFVIMAYALPLHLRFLLISVILGSKFSMLIFVSSQEYLYLDAVRTQYASEFGHLIRVITIYTKVEFAFDGLNDPETGLAPQAALVEAEHALESWLDSLPEHLRFSEQNLQVQLSMFETSSNTGAWCWCSIHTYHASCALALNLARQRSQRGQKTEPRWALNIINSIMDMLGDRAKNSVLMGAALYTLIKYCKRDDAQIRNWCVEYEDAWGTRIAELAQECRQQPSPSAQHQYPPNSHQQPLTPQHQAAEHSSQHQQQLHHPSTSHHRLSDTRHPGALSNSHSGPQPPYSSQGGEPSIGSKRRSPSDSPRSYPLGRLDEPRLHNSSSRPIHPLPLPDRDGRLGATSLVTGSAGGIGPSGGHGGNDSYVPYSEREKEGSPGTGSSDGSPPGNLGGFSNGGQRDGQSLPSLKASGLLDSWNTGSRDMKPQFNGNSGTRLPSPRRTPPMQQQPPSIVVVNNDSDVRSTASLGMPIGLPWLAHDSR
ncbi:hypothetical protein AN958_09890 [Leucoagaricus sp. SymC.cos]|nr:hypothetical protein AN958_09890 [Leucoagaricus sp. SymC.cos]